MKGTARYVALASVLVLSLAGAVDPEAYSPVLPRPHTASYGTAKAALCSASFKFTVSGSGGLERCVDVVRNAVSRYEKLVFAFGGAAACGGGVEVTGVEISVEDMQSCHLTQDMDESYSLRVPESGAGTLSAKQVSWILFHLSTAARKVSGRPGTWAMMAEADAVDVEEVSGWSSQADSSDVLTDAELSDAADSDSVSGSGSEAEGVGYAVGKALAKAFGGRLGGGRFS